MDKRAETQKEKSGFVRLRRCLPALRLLPNQISTQPDFSGKIRFEESRRESPERCIRKYKTSRYTLKPWYNEPRYSEFYDKRNKTQLPFWGFTKHIIFDKVNYSIKWTKRVWETYSLYQGLSVHICQRKISKKKLT